jgi:uncharacterized protein YecT (DUF1311 family)
MKIYLTFLFLVPLFCFGQTQLEMNTQSFQDYEKADAKMVLVYKKVLKTFTDEAAKKIFIEAQRAWIKYKETHCKFIASGYEGGSMKPMIYSSCLMGITNQRTKQLHEYLNEQIILK